MHPRLDIQRFPERTLPRLLAAAARNHPDRTFLRFIEPAAPDAPPRRLSFRDFAAGAGRAAAFLRAAGVGPGRVVGAG